MYCSSNNFLSQSWRPSINCQIQFFHDATEFDGIIISSICELLAYIRITQKVSLLVTNLLFVKGGVVSLSILSFIYLLNLINK